MSRGGRARRGSLARACDDARGVSRARGGPAVDTDVIVKWGVAVVVAKAANDHFRAVYGIDAFGTIRRFWRKVVDDLRGAVPRPCCLLYTSPSPRDGLLSRMPSSA